MWEKLNPDLKQFDLNTLNELGSRRFARTATGKMSGS